MDDDIVSGASIDGLAFDLPVSRTELARYLREFGPLRIGGSSSGAPLHVVSCELWTVGDGHLMPGGIDQHDVVARWAGVVGGFTGAMWGGALGLLAGARTNDAARLFAAAGDGARVGFKGAATIAGAYARRVSERTALGPYHELLVSVPDVCLGDSPIRYTAVLDMLTDDVLAQSVDRWFGYGYHKQLCRFALPEEGSFDVRVNEQSVVSGCLRKSDDPRGRDHGLRLDELNTRWAQPLLGGLHDGRWRSSRLERRIDAGVAACWGVRGSVEVRGNGVTTPLIGDFLVGENDALAVAFVGVPTRISHPRPLTG